MNEKIAAAKNFVNRHKVALTATATAVVTTTIAIALTREGVKQRDEFLKEHNLLETFYAQFEDEA